ncbi:Glycerophosphoryl diester phosphodiesterase [Trema orientale]|uniref:glycerophosphodiester phosphodiesterase n=1 Tax=Trema orientale TaxID=63057 RepID=A0A2P5F229_TREOI|nr:Glycerophosphoryl diester phosphodiesterase [Trema orientale]
MSRESGKEWRKLMVIGHRGSGMNLMNSSAPDSTLINSIKENSILSFNSAAAFPIDYVEFDVQFFSSFLGDRVGFSGRVRWLVACLSFFPADRQRVGLNMSSHESSHVTKDDCPVIFHDNFILTKDKGIIVEKRISEITLDEFLSYGPQKQPGMVGKPLFRKTKDWRIFEWKVENDDSLCTLEEAFQKVEHSVGFNIELKFDDNIVYKVEELAHVLEAVLKVVNEYAMDRPIIFSSFQPDAAQLIRKLQNTPPVYFLTNGGSEVYADVRRNSLDEAIKLCLEGGLQGLVSQVKAIFRNPGMITRIKESKLRLITYGQLNNVPEVLYMQHLMGVEGVIVDFVQEITEAVSDYIHPAEEGEENSLFEEDGERRAQARKKPQFSQRQLSFLLKLIPELIQH